MILVNQAIPSYYQANATGICCHLWILAAEAAGNWQDDIIEGKACRRKCDIGPIRVVISRTHFDYTGPTHADAPL